MSHDGCIVGDGVPESSVKLSQVESSLDTSLGLIAHLPIAASAIGKCTKNQRNGVQRILQAEMLRINRILDGVKQQEVLLLESNIDKHTLVP